MTVEHGYVVSTEWLKERLGSPEIAIVDCRFVLGQPEAGRAAYAEGHIPGAVYLDLEGDLSDPVEKHGGRHPLPSPERLAAALEHVGIGSDKLIVAYDDQGGAMASRLWWLLSYLGHERAVILDEGFAGWRQNGGSVTGEETAVEPAQFIPRLQPQLVVTVERVREVSAAIQNGTRSTLLIDSRDGARYRGEIEPIDIAAGHIPGAINLPWLESRDAEGHWRDEAAQRQRFAGLAASEAKELIVYCGSGVTACPNVLALRQAGFDRDSVKLYAGSWSDWISYEGNPIKVGDE